MDDRNSCLFPSIMRRYCAGTFRNVVDVAVKTLKVGSMAPEAFIDEAKTMHQLRHRKLVQLLGVCSNPMYIITERMVNGSLLDYLRKEGKGTIKFQTLVDMAAQVYILLEVF